MAVQSISGFSGPRAPWQGNRTSSVRAFGTAPGGPVPANPSPPASAGSPRTPSSADAAARTGPRSSGRPGPRRPRRSADGPVCPRAPADRAGRGDPGVADDRGPVLPGGQAALGLPLRRTTGFRANLLEPAGTGRPVPSFGRLRPRRGPPAPGRSGDPGDPLGRRPEPAPPTARGSGGHLRAGGRRPGTGAADAGGTAPSGRPDDPRDAGADRGRLCPPVRAGKRHRPAGALGFLRDRRGRTAPRAPDHGAPIRRGRRPEGRPRVATRDRPARSPSAGSVRQGGGASPYPFRPCTRDCSTMTTKRNPPLITSCQ